MNFQQKLHNSAIFGYFYFKIIWSFLYRVGIDVSECKQSALLLQYCLNFQSVTAPSLFPFRPLIRNSADRDTKSNYISSSFECISLALGAAGSVFHVALNIYYHFLLYKRGEAL